jgi:hypothetical protein
MKKTAIILLVLLICGFGYGLSRLFQLRFSTGDIYPAYSSLRSDPLGTRGLYESLDRLIGSERNYRPLLRDDRGREKVLFVLGADPQELRVSDTDVKDLEQFITTGGRLVLAFRPAFTARAITPARTTNAPTRKKSIAGVGERPEGVSLGERWRFDLQISPLTRQDDGINTAAPAEKVASLDLPAFISSHTAVTLTALDPVWNTIYARTNDRPVVLERKFGAGSIALSADSFLFSNEALLKERQSALLAWFVGPARSVIFDETHLGVQEHRGVATLARQYRLHGFLAAVLVLAALFVWRYGFSLVPASEEQVRRETGDWVAGKESAAGFTNLLRRNIPPRALLSACLEEWNKSCRHRASLPKLERMQAIIDAENARPTRETNPVKAYQQIAQVMARSSRRGSQSAPPQT